MRIGRFSRCEPRAPCSIVEGARGLPEGWTAMQLRGGGGRVVPVEGRLSEPSTGDACGRPSERMAHAPTIEVPEGVTPPPDVALAWMLRLGEWLGAV